MGLFNNADKDSSSKGGFATVLLLAVVISAAAAAGVLINRGGFQTVSARSEPEEVRYTMTTKALVSDIPKGTKVIDLWLPYPQDMRDQEITDVQVDSPYEFDVKHDREYGNAILHTRVKNPKKDFTVAIERQLQELRASKTDRVALSTLLAEVAKRLKDGEAEDS